MYKFGSFAQAGCLYFSLIRLIHHFTKSDNMYFDTVNGYDVSALLSNIIIFYNLYQDNSRDK